MNRQCEISFNGKTAFGVAVLAIAMHAVLLATIVSMSIPQPSCCSGPHDSIVQRLKDAKPMDPPAMQVGRLAEPVHVNKAAQGELKQQNGACQPYRIVGPTVVYPTQTRPKTPATTAVKPKDKKLYQLALFLDGSERSRVVKLWFDKHAGLVQMRKGCSFQTYTSGNAIYKSRFADVVPVNHFPAVLFLDANGGHIHAAGGPMLPSTADGMLSDLKAGFQLYHQARNAPKTGALRGAEEESKGYNWDANVRPDMRLSDCPDGNCPNDTTTDLWRPGQRVRDVLFGPDTVPRNALMWFSQTEILTSALVVIALVLLGWILWKRR